MARTLTDVSLTSSVSRRSALVAAVVGLVLVVLAAVVLTRVVSGDDAAEDAPARGPTSTSTPPPPPLSTPLADYDTTTVTVQRAGFCDLVDPEAVSAMLGGEPGEARTYGNGESARITPEVTDIAHEHGCLWRRGRTELRAWVFAPPVSPDGADRLVADARRGEGCVVRRQAPAYGSPSLARTCTTGVGVGEGQDRVEVVESSYRGLFGDAWLACSLTAPAGRAGTLQQAGAWCVEVAEAAAQPPA